MMSGLIIFIKSPTTDNWYTEPDEHGIFEFDARFKLLTRGDTVQPVRCRRYPEPRDNFTLRANGTEFAAFVHIHLYGITNKINPGRHHLIACLFRFMATHLCQFNPDANVLELGIEGTTHQPLEDPQSS